MREFYNEDCMEGMKRYPDKFFDLAIVDPPYGDGNTLTEGGGRWNRFGQRFDRYKTPPTAEELSKTGRNLGLSELVEHGRGNTQKNHIVGCCPKTGILH